LKAEEVWVLLAVVLAFAVIPTFIINFCDYGWIISGNEWIGFFGNFFGALTGGLITLFVMWKTLENNKTLQDDKRYEEEKDNVRKLILLWQQQRYEVDASFEEWNLHKRVYNTKYTLLALSDGLDILAKIHYLDSDEGTKILDFNSNMLILERRRDNYSRTKGIDESELTDEQKHQKELYSEAVGRIHNQIWDIDKVIKNLREKYSI